MAKAEHGIKLEWKEFNLDLNAVHVWMQANAGEQYCGLQAATQLELWFLADPGQEITEDIAAYWEALDEESDEAVNYQTAEQIKASADAARAALVASAAAKLEALGLSAEEIAALKG